MNDFSSFKKMLHVGGNLIVQMSFMNILYKEINILLASSRYFTF